MAKDDEKTKPQGDPDQDLWDAFGIDDEESQKRVKQLAAARVLAHRRINPPKDKPKSGGAKWGEE